MKSLNAGHAGVPQDVHDRADHRITIPMQPAARSMNVAMSCAMITGEALRQLGNAFVAPDP